jgi:hypothetical protein
MKKFIALLMLFTLVFSLLSCEATVEKPKPNIDENEKEENNDEQNNVQHEESLSKFFYSIAEFDAYRNSPDNVKGKRLYFDNSLYVDFDSIIPNSEIECIVLDNGNTYEIRYLNETNRTIIMEFNIVEDYVLSEGGLTPIYIMDCRIEDLDDIYGGGNHYIFVVDGIEVRYKFYNRNGEISLEDITFIIGNHLFKINQPFNKYNTPIQQEFVDAFKTEAGTSDMLDKIKALIPKS